MVADRSGTPQNRGWYPPCASLFETLSFMLTLYAPRLPADPFARSAVSPQRNLLAAQSPCSAVSIIPSKPGRAPGVGQGPQKKGPGAQGRPGGPGGGARCARARADARFARGGPSGPGPLRGPGGPLIRNKSYAERNR
jgi:hypothetical protein